jgi:hypothetical protein
MSGTSLRDFVCRAIENRRISFGDLRRLQRDILPGRITTREEAEILLAIDRAVDRADRGWSAYLTRAVADFVVMGSEPTGHIDGDKARWLMIALYSSAPKTARAVTAEIVRRAPRFDDNPRAFAPIRTAKVAEQLATRSSDACDGDGLTKPAVSKSPEGSPSTHSTKCRD